MLQFILCDFYTLLLLLSVCFVISFVVVSSFLKLLISVVALAVLIWSTGIHTVVGVSAVKLPKSAVSIDFHCLYCVSKKPDTMFLPITLTNGN